MYTSVPRPIKGTGILPVKQSACLRYSGSTTLTGTNAGVAITLRANSCNDPEYVLGGGQPRGYDELTALYGKYVVRKATLKVMFFNGNNVSANLNTVQVPFIRVDEAPHQTGDEVSFKGIKEYPYSVCPNTLLSTSSDGKEASASLTSYVDIGRFKGVKDILDADDLSAGSSSNPSSVLYFNIGVCNPFGTSTEATSCKIAYELVQDVVFLEPKQPGAS